MDVDLGLMAPSGMRAMGNFGRAWSRALPLLVLHALVLAAARPTLPQQPPAPQHTPAPSQPQRPQQRRPVLLASGMTREGPSPRRVDDLVHVASTLVELGPGPDVEPLRKRLWRRVSMPMAPTSSRIVINLVLWWCLNVVFNLANKQCLNSWPHPWALATLHLAIGSACMLPLYIPLPRGRGCEWVAMRKFPQLTWSELRTLFPVVALLAIGHVTSTLAPAYGTVAFSNIVKTAEPFFTCLFSFLLYRRAAISRPPPEPTSPSRAAARFAHPVAGTHAAGHPLPMTPVGASSLSRSTSRCSLSWRESLSSRRVTSISHPSPWAPAWCRTPRSRFIPYGRSGRWSVRRRSVRVQPTLCSLSAAACSSRQSRSLSSGAVPAHPASPPRTSSPPSSEVRFALARQRVRCGEGHVVYFGSPRMPRTAVHWFAGRLAILLVLTGFIQYLSNEIAFCTLSMIHPVTCVTPQARVPLFRAQRRYPPPAPDADGCWVGPHLVEWAGFVARLPAAVLTVCVGLGRIVASEIDVPNMLWIWYNVDER